MKKIILVLCMIAAGALALSACGSPARLLEGSWSGSVGPLEFRAMEFIPNEGDPLRGEVNLGLAANLIDGSYEITPGRGREQHRLEITYALAGFSTSRVFYFTVDNDTLVMQRDGSSVSLTYTRG